MAKPLSLADRIAQTKKENENQQDRKHEKKLVESLSSESKDTAGVRLGSGQGQVKVRSSEGRPSIDTVSTQGQVKVNSGSGQGQVSSIRSGSGQGQVSSIKSDDADKKITLGRQQQRVYEWFLNEGDQGYFNKGIMSRDTDISHPTIRKSIKKLESLSLLKIHKYDPVSRRQKYELNPDKKVLILSIDKQTKTDTVRSRSGQGQVSSIRSRSGQVSHPSYKKERKIFLINLSFSDFWLDQGLTQHKLEAWIEEFDFTEEDWKAQLAFGAHEPKVKSADSPIKYFYKSLKQGGLTRPDGFEFPEERRAKIRKKELEARMRLIAEEEKLRLQEKELAEKEAFLSLLKDKELIEEAIVEFEKSFISSKFKISINTFRKSGHVDERLESRLKMWFRDSKECT